MQRPDDAACDVVLNREDIVHFAVEAVGPQLVAALRVDELRGHAQPLAGLAHAALEHVADIEVARHLAHVDRLVAIAQGRVARDDEQFGHGGEQGDDVLNHALGDVVLIGFAGQRLERQHRDRRTAARPAGRFVPIRQIRRCGFRLGDEAEAAARKGLDHRLVAAAVADGAAQGVDAGVQGRVRDRAAVPDRLDQLVLADDAVAMLDQVGEQAEHLRFQRLLFALARQFQPFRVEGIVAEADHQDL